ncbi:MAG TPA: vWA domain-containing protein, partial [Gammaproteobacteria bacterium]|nr:vWA domain-containing protein [Gammaproteobacteria bacterium]
MSEIRFKSRLFLIPLFLIGNITHAAGSITDNLGVDCRQSKSRLTCDYRVLDSEPVIAISADYGDISLPVKEQAGYPWPGATTAILIVVDTSDPARQPVIEKNRQHIDAILKATEDHHRVGLASFDKSLRLEVPVGLSHGQISSRAAQLQATGKTTELYRSMLMAIERLENVDAERKSIYLFSDGLAEDKAYFHQDVVKAARQSGIIINSMGYPRSVPKSVALQTLRRLSEETGGIFVEADDNFNLPADFMAAPFQNIDNGGRVEIDLSTVMQSGNSAKGPFVLTVETDLGPNRFTGNLNLPAPKPVAAKTAEPPQVAETPPTTPQPPIQVITKTEPAPVDSWFWYGIPVALIVLILLTITTFLILVFRKEPQRDHAAETYSDFKPFAYLIAQNETKK